MNNKILYLGFFVTAIILLFRCASADQNNQLTSREKSEGWVLAFDGESFDGWRGINREGMPPGHWIVEDGCIKKVANDEVPEGSSGGDILIDRRFDSFEFMLDWKISDNGNSGIKYNVSEEMSGGHGALGFEYQIIDDAGHPGVSLEEINTTGCLYALLPPVKPEEKILHPVGEWNTSKIIVNGKHGEHWLNGQKLLEFEIESPELDSLIANSKYHTIPDFGKKRTGYIVLQDHSTAAWYRNIKYRIPE